MYFLSLLKKLPATAYLVAFLTFCMRAGHFMSMPFLAIYLTREGLMTGGQIGLILGAAGFMLSVTGLMNGMYVDRHSHKLILMISLALAALCYFALGFSMHIFYGLLLLNASLGWFRSLAEISAITLLVTTTPTHQLGSAYSVRFIGANLGVALGPLIGAMMAVHQSLMIFFIAGMINIGLVVLIFFYKEAPKAVHDAKLNIKIWDNFKLIIKDKILLNVTFINFILWTAYSQLDTTFPQYLAGSWPNPAKLFSILMVLNALICVFFQPFIMRWAELTSLKISGIVGSILFASSLLLIGLCPSEPCIFISVIMMSFAELLTLPINNLLVTRIAPKHLIASYNGLSNLGLLGLSLGPALGGYGLDLIDGRYVFMLMGVLPLLAIFSYLKYIKD